ncbi:ribbon-helix-helix domain-containing protein [Roseibium sp.]|uniref:ribbon-helix-helix domain-containing protein n=1 Tax=Roseibium sp. TaxID=1936156 RepID=UPI003A97BE7C
MSAVEKIIITVPANLAQRLRQSVDGGEYASANEVISEALQEWAMKRDAGIEDLETLKQEIKAGLESGAPLSADDVFADLRARYAKTS